VSKKYKPQHSRLLFIDRKIGEGKYLNCITLAEEWEVSNKTMHMDTIIRCENENLDWEVMTIDKDDIEVSTARDSEVDVERIASQLKMEEVVFYRRVWFWVHRSLCFCHLRCLLD
jgi:hypothetical protein